MKIREKKYEITNYGLKIVFILCFSLIFFSGCSGEKHRKKVLSDKDKLIIKEVKSLKLTWNYSSWIEESIPSITESNIIEKLQKSGFTIVPKEKNNYEAEVIISCTLNKGRPIYFKDKLIGYATDSNLNVTFIHKNLGEIFHEELEFPGFGVSKGIILFPYEKGKYVYVAIPPDFTIDYENNFFYRNIKPMPDTTEILIYSSETRYTGILSTPRLSFPVYQPPKKQIELYYYCANKFKESFYFKYFGQYLQLMLNKKSRYSVWADIVSDFIDDKCSYLIHIDEITHLIGILDDVNLVDNLISLLHHKNWKVKAAAIRLLYEIRRHNKRSSGDFFTADTISFPNTRIEDKSLISPLIELSKELLPYPIRLRTFLIIGQMRDTYAINKIIETMKKESIWDFKLSKQKKIIDRRQSKDFETRLDTLYFSFKIYN